MDTVRLHRKVPNSSEYSHITRYRVAKPSQVIEFTLNGKGIIHPWWNVYIEGCENTEGLVFSTNQWKNILEKYDVVEDNLTESLPE